MIVTKIFLLTGSGILAILGGLHLWYTFFTNKLSPGQQATIQAMQADHMHLTRETTIWKAWIGFNASHSLGPIILAGVNILLVIGYPKVICRSVALLLFDVIVSCIYLLLARRYWFKIPLRGIALAALCYLAALLSGCGIFFKN